MKDHRPAKIDELTFRYLQNQVVDLPRHQIDQGIQSERGVSRTLRKRAAGQGLAAIGTCREQQAQTGGLRRSGFIGHMPQIYILGAPLA